MTTTAEPETERPDIIDKGLLKVKDVHGVSVYINPQDGSFNARFSQGSGVKWFERSTLTQLELLIAQHALDFSGQVEVGTVPDVPLHSYDIANLEKRLAPDSRESSYSRIYQHRPTKTITGVQRVERKSGGTNVVFRLDNGETESLSSGIKPNPVLDQSYYDLAMLYLENLRSWKARFDALVAQYEPITAQQIVDELRTQGARTGRA